MKDRGSRKSLVDTQLLMFGIISGVALAIMIYLLIEESDVVDIPLIPVFMSVCVFGALGIILTFFELELSTILLIASGISVGLFIGVYYTFKSMVTKPVDLAAFTGRKAIVEIPIDPNSTGRIKLLGVEQCHEFPAKASTQIAKNREVLIESIAGAIAFVIPIPDARVTEAPSERRCGRCSATIKRRTAEYCPNCGERL